MVGPDPRGALVALNRFGFGARPGDLAAAATDPRGFLKQEAGSAGVAQIAAPLPASHIALQEMFADQERARQEREAAAKAAATSPSAGAATEPPPQTAMQPAGGAATPPHQPTPEQQLFRAEALALFQKQSGAPAGFVERLVAFWSNHFAVSAAKGAFVRVAAGPFEREAIRPHVLGRFKDMVLAVESHPAMLFYLDNQQSIGPNSQAGRNRRKGLNENLARETLELHTLGVSGGYSQADVTSLARILTGWTFAGREGRNGEPGTFAFIPNWHEPGAQPLLGKSYAESGQAQGEAALADLARHPATAVHVATKLARHFVADDPPPLLIAQLAEVFRDTQGDLKEVSFALIDADAAWSAPLTKMRTPMEFLIAAARATGFTPSDSGTFLGPLNAMGMPLWQPPGPNGFADTAAAWASPEAMKLRLDVAWQIAQRTRDTGNPLSVLDTVAGLAASRETREAVARAESRPQALAILFMSPEFQRR
ncbi:MAG: DUF1800 family protein [Methylocapsa sp.]|nr:DUF1800 family protein [Methylocapsa sp.]